MTTDPAERIQMLNVGGRVLRVATRDGNPGRPPLLLCNGIGGRLELFQPFADALDPRRGVIRFDMPGIGESPAPVVPYHLATLAPMLTGLLDQLGVARADVLGISWGGGLAQQFALSRPDRVHRLVLVATGPGALMVPGHPKVLLHMLTPRRHRDPGHAARIAGQLYGGSLREEPALARELLHATARLGAARGYYYQLLSGIGWTSLPRLPRLRTPTLILAGDDDPIIPLVNARIMHRLIPDSQLHVYHGGHLELGPGDLGQNLDSLAREATAADAYALGVAGGDAWLAVVAAMAAAHGIPFVCVPAGMRNHFAFDVGVDRHDLIGALDAFTGGVEREIDMAEVNGRTFVNDASVGIYGDAVSRSACRYAKVRTLLGTAAEVMGPSAEAPALDLVDDLGARAS